MALLVLLAPLAALAQNHGAQDTLHWQEMTPTRQRALLSGNWFLVSSTGDKPQPVQIPGYQAGASKLIYQRDFYLDAALQGHAVRLSMLGINYACTILINGVFVAGHSGGYTSFDVMLKPSALKFGQMNTIRIEVDGHLSPWTTLPAKHRPFGWRNLTGILRDVYLEALPAIAIDDVSLRTTFSDDFRQASLSFALTLRRFNEVIRSDLDSLASSGALSVFIEARLPDRPQKIIAQTRKIPVRFQNASQVRQGMSLSLTHPETWQPSDPRLYEFTVYLLQRKQIIDQMRVRTGLRKIEILGQQVYLNGHPLPLKGVDWIEDLEGLSGKALVDTIDHTLRQVALLGANAIRSVGHPLHPAVIRACSEKGIMVLQELPVYYANAKQLRSPQMISLATHALKEMIRRDKLQPSVLAWGLGSHLQVHAAETENFLQQLAKKAHELDHRPVYYVARTLADAQAVQIPDFLLLDVFEKAPERFGLQTLRGKPVLPIMGYFVKPWMISKKGLAPQRRMIEAEEMQAGEIQRALDYFQNIWPIGAGAFIHSLRDWRTDFPLLATGPRSETSVCPAGLVRLGGKPRIGFRVIAAHNLADRLPPISPNHPRLQAPVAFPVIGVGAILIFLFFLNRDKRLRGHLRRVFVHPHGFYMDIRENRKIPVFLTVLLGGFEGLIWAGIVAGGLYAFRQSLALDEMLNLVAGNANFKQLLVWLIWHPVAFIFGLAGLYFVGFFALAVLLRILGFFFGEILPQMQYATLVFWTASCYLPLAIIAPISYRLAIRAGMLQMGLVVLLAFIFWHLIRLSRGLRVIFFIPVVRAVLIILSLFIIFWGSLGWYFQHSQALFDYVAYYSALF